MLLRRDFSNEIRKLDDHEYLFTASDESVDRYNTVIKSNGWVLDNFNKNPIALYNHNSGSSDPTNVIGKWRVWVENGKLMSALSLAPSEVNPKAATIKGLMDFGAISAVSVGFNPVEWTKGIADLGENPKVLYFRKQELLEISVVDIPANPNALKNEYSEFARMAMEEEGVEVKTPETKPDPFKTRYYKLIAETL